MSIKNRTYEAIENQLRAMACEKYEIGIRDANSEKMMQREWTKEEILKSISFLQRMNAQGADIYIRPHASEDRALILIDDVDGVTIEKLKDARMTPALIVETSHKNMQVWIDFGTEKMDAENRKLIAKTLAKGFDGDMASAASSHFGRLAGFTNRKEKHLTYKGFPYVLCLDSKGIQAERGQEFRESAKEEIRRRVEASKLKNATSHAVIPYNSKKDANEAYKAYTKECLEHQDNGKSIDWSKIDYAVASRLLKEGIAPETIANAMATHSPNILERKGVHSADYAQRTVNSALKHIEIEETPNNENDDDLGFEMNP